MRWIQINTAKSLTYDPPTRPSGAGTAVVCDVRGGTLETITPTRDAVDTTLAANADAGAQTLSLTSATGVAAGRSYLVGGAEESGGEWVTLRALSGTTATLVRKLQRARASGVTFVGTRMTFPVTAASTATPGRNFRVEWTTPTSEVIPVPFDVTRYAPQSGLTGESIRTLDPQFFRRVSAEEWLPGRVAEAWEMLLRHLSQGYAPGGFVGLIDLTTAHGYLVRALLAETFGKSDEAMRELEDLRGRYAQERDAAMGAMAYDEAQTGAASNRRGYHRTIRLVRG